MGPAWVSPGSVRITPGGVWVVWVLPGRCHHFQTLEERWVSQEKGFSQWDLTWYQQDYTWRYGSGLCSSWHVVLLTDHGGMVISFKLV